MSSFSSANQIFLRELQTSVRGLNLSDRAQNYKDRFQAATRARLRDYYSTLTDFGEKTSFYSDALSSLMEFEFQFLVLSIYFERDPEVLFGELRNTINQCVPVNYKDEYGLLHFTTVKQINPPTLRDFLTDIFKQLIGLRNLPFSKEDNTNPEIYHLSKWLLEALKDSNNDDKIARVLLHYNRYWASEYYEPSRYEKKGIILFDKINRVLANTPIDVVKVNLLDLINKLKMDTSSLLPTNKKCPFTDDRMAAESNNNIVKGYLNRVSEFNLLLQRNSIFFENLFSTSLATIVEMHRSLNSKLRPHFEKIVCKSFLDGRGLKVGELDVIKALRHSDDYSSKPELKDFCDKLIAINYLYELRCL